MLTPDTSIFFATGPITSNPKFTPSAFITHAANVMIEQAEAELTSCWKDAARRFGPTAAGATLQDFVINNTKCLDFDPYLRDPQENVQVLFKSKEVRSAQIISPGPLTYDCFLVYGECAPTSEHAQVIHPTGGFVLVYDKVFLLHRNSWMFHLQLPKPGQGTVLEEWEQVGVLAARFTLPFPLNDISE